MKVVEGVSLKWEEVWRMGAGGAESYTACAAPSPSKICIFKFDFYMIWGPLLRPTWSKNLSKMARKGVLEAPSEEISKTT